MHRALLLTIAVFTAGLSLAGPETTGRAQGNPQAPVRIDLYSDYQCPACKLFHDQTLSQVTTAYVRTGKVYLVHHEYPLPIHAHAREAACLALASCAVGRYEQVSDQLFRTQDSWSKDGNVAAAACSILDPADAKKVRALATSPETEKQLEEDVRDGHNESVNGTPTMIITKMMRRWPVVGPVSYAVLSRFLDSILN